MKKLFIILVTLMVITSCATTNEAKLSRIEGRKDKKLAEQASVKQAVESKRFIIKFDRIYFLRGGMVDLIPTANYIVIDEDKAIINTAYVGRQFDIRPITAINMKGKSLNYTVKDISSRGIYEIKMEVANGKATKFDLNLSIGENGSCNVSVSSLMIDNVNYSGHIIPMEPKKVIPDQNHIMI